MSAAIKLFGKTISFCSPGNYKDVSDVTEPEEQQSTSATSVCSVDNKDVSGCMAVKTKHGDNSTSSISETLAEAATLSSTTDDSKTPSSDKCPLSPKTPKKDEPSEGSVSPDVTLKKPDKLLPCPRCNSMNTKFCYYNNYNVSQPRHFCKNCQRYWTAGGTMRNVPVGSGRRKNKTVPNPNYHHIIVSDDFSLNPNRFLIFGSDGSERSQNRVPNDFYEHSSQSSPRVTNSTEKGCSELEKQESRPILQNMPPHIPCFPQPVFGPSGIPVAFYPTIPYWGGAWGAPTSILGKHSREGTILTTSNTGMENNSGKILSPKSAVLAPKTLRIDDPNEAAKSSIWSTLGIKNNERNVSINGTSLFKAFSAKGNSNINVDNGSMVLQANPAALSRSRNFHESV